MRNNYSIDTSRDRAKPGLVNKMNTGMVECSSERDKRRHDAHQKEYNETR